MKMSEDNFVSIPFDVTNLDLYFIRTTIREAIRNNFVNFEGNLLDIGCGKMPYRKFILDNSKVKEYIGLDIETALPYDKSIRPDVTWDGKIMPFENNTFDCAIGTEVLEHCPDPDNVFKEVYRVLKSQGILFGTVPFLWPLHETPHDEYRYTPYSLERHLNNAGFNKINIKATGGWHGAMAQMLGLWVRRSNIPLRKRKLFSNLLKPVIKKLIKMDHNNVTHFKEGQMITGLTFTAIK